ANIIAEGTVTNGAAALKARYIRGNGLAARADANGAKTYYLHNGHGDVVGLTDGSGNVVNRYTYDIWGNPLTVTEQVPQPFRYSGEFWDNSAHLQYLRARWYDPSVGRFMSQDTYEGDIANPLSLNLYTYVHNNPLRYTDPSGHEIYGEGCYGPCYMGYNSTPQIYSDITTGILKSWQIVGSLAVDDINTIADPNSSTFDKTLAGAGFIPIGKVIKGGKLVIQLANEARSIERTVEATTGSIRVAGKIGTEGLQGFKYGITADEIKTINNSFGGQIELNGSIETVLDNASRYDGFWNKTAAITRSIVNNHTFDNGNKRTALSVIQELMSRNEISTGVSESAMRDVISKISTGDLTDVSDIAKSLRGF
ncbi:RHS repeat-associated core domain-containing protein, partial [Paenibacillus ehimensis]